MSVTSREISSVMTSAANNYNTRLDSSVRIKTRIHTYLGFVSALPQLRLGYASTTPWFRSPPSIVARHAMTLIVRLGT